jgi:hypothetical protein
MIKGQQMLKRDKTIVVDAGDFSMGTLLIVTINGQKLSD